MGGDPPPEHYEKPKGSPCQSTSTIGEAERIFRALSEKGTVYMPIQETFWALRFGILTDQFGTPWMINCEKPDRQVITCRLVGNPPRLKPGWTSRHR